MSPDIILVALIVLPIVLLFVLRVSATFVFLSLCLGDVLERFVGRDAATVIGGSGSAIKATGSYLQLSLLLAPAVLTMIFMIHTVRGRKKFLNLLPALGTGLLMALLVVPLLPPGLSHTIVTSSSWAKIEQLQSAIVLSSAVLCLLFLLMQRPKHGGGDEKHGKKH